MARSLDTAEERLSRGGIAEATMRGERPLRGGYFTSLGASYTHSLQLILRRQRLLLAAGIALLPVLIPIALAFLSTGQYADDGSIIFNRMATDVYIVLLAPLLALFFASMLVGEEVEMQTLPYLLTRPIPRSAWVFGRYFAYLTITASISLASLGLTFTGSTALAGLGFNVIDLKLLAHYGAVNVVALAAYGAFALFLGAVTKRPIVIGVLVLYGWQQLANFVPGLIDFLTIQKYTDALLPTMVAMRHNVELQTAIGAYNKEVILVGAVKAGITLAVITVLFLAVSVFTVRRREYASARAVGS